MQDTVKFAHEWIDAWNSHDLPTILLHYSDDIEITSPMIRLAAGIDSGRLKGRKEVEHYWDIALQRFPDLHFELIEVAGGVNSVAIHYKSIMNTIAIELMFFNEDNKVNRMFAHYATKH